MARAAGRIEVERQGAPRSSASALVAWVLATTLLGILLWQVDGAPWEAWRGWDWQRLRATLAGSRLSDSDIVLLATTIAWLALSYLALTLVLRLLVGLADALTGGAAWTRTALSLTNLVTLPAVRRAVDGAVAGTLLVTSCLPAAQRVAVAAEVRPTVVATTPLPDPSGFGQPGEQPASEHTLQTAGQVIEYTVAPGDYLWDIARRIYGDGSRYIDVFELNRDRVMTNGERFTDPRLIRAGWVLDIPLPGANLSVEGDTISYRVRRGDHLWGIAERFLGDGFRWVEIWERNGGGEMAGGLRFTNPNLIHPGWMLELPLAVSEPPPRIPRPAAGAQPSAQPSVEPSAPTAVPPPYESLPDASLAPELAELMDEEGSGGLDVEWPSLPREVLLTAAGFAVIGGTALFVRRLAQSGMLTLPARGSRRRDPPGDAGRVSLATSALAAALADYGFAESAPLLVIESGRRLEFTVACPHGDAEALAGASHDLARRLACEVAAEVAGATRVTVTLSGFQRLAALLGSPSETQTPLVVPVGADARGIVYLNLAAAGSVAISGPASERRQLLRSWLATLSTVLGPDELVLRFETRAARLLGAGGEPPHVALAAASDAADLAEELDELIESRRASDARRPVLAIVDLADGGADRLDAVRRYGPRAGVYVIAGEETRTLDREAFGASIAIGALADEVAEDDQGMPDGGALLLALGRDEPYRLEPVHVRRDISPRWKESAEVATFDPPFGGSPAEASLAEHAVEAARPAFEAPPLAADFTFDVGGGEEPSGPTAPAEDPGEAHAAGVRGVVERSDAEHDVQPDQDPVPLSGFRSTPPPVDVPIEEPEARSESGGEAEPWTPLSDAERKPETERDGSAPLSLAAESVPEHGAEVTRPPASLAFRQGTLLPDEGFAADSRSPDETSGTVFSVRCLGRFEVRIGETVVSRWSPEKSRELLTFLAAHGGDSVASEIAAEALWPDYAWDEGVRHLISNAASGIRSALRKAAGRPDLQPLSLARQRLHLQRSLFRTDIDALESTLRRAASLPERDALAEYERAFDLYSSEFLEGELYSWVGDYRIEHAQRMLGALRRAVAIAEQLGESERAVRLHRLTLEREPTDEAAARGVMRHLAAAGDCNAARKVYRALTESLQSELDDPRAAPGAETRALYEELIAGEATR